MTTSIFVTAEAQRDAARLAAFIASGSPTAARRARATILSAIQSLDRFSERGAPACRPPDGLRELFAPFGRAGYVIQYVVDADLVTVLRIFHSLEER
ncbi:MAG: type II toxin-antitoxin system RelE/ParE family toxin [Caulobacterales bacterium]|nr:type II toxin-antitoxin system RelE/ParE family toxin [Caulobacterales bacterium]